MHYDYDTLDQHPLGDNGLSRATVALLEGDTADDPTSTRHVFHGPATVTYITHPDGGITADYDTGRNA